MKFKDKNIVLFPAQLKEVSTEKLVAERLSDDINLEFNIEVSTEGKIVNDNTAKSIITIKIYNETYLIEVKKAGIYEFEERIEKEEDAVLFMETQGIRILWSYLREDIYSISSKMLPKPFMLPTIDVMKTLERAE